MCAGIDGGGCRSRVPRRLARVLDGEMGDVGALFGGEIGIRTGRTERSDRVTLTSMAMVRTLRFRAALSVLQIRTLPRETHTLERESRTLAV